MTYGLVLEGGGGRGGFHIGVWQALRELNIEINGVTGTSVGALNGALFALGKYDEAVKLWSNIQTTDVLDVDDKIFNELFHGKKKPDSLEAYSGQFKLRIPRSLHRSLAEHSKREGISMNQYCVYLLSKNDAVYSK